MFTFIHDDHALPITTATAFRRWCTAVFQWRDDGQIIELSRGVFRQADAPTTSYPDLLAVAYRSPIAIVCCRTAAVVHDLSDEMPPAVQIAVSTSHRPPQISWPPTEVLRFEAANFELGLSRIEAAPGERVRIYDPLRTVIDLMRLRGRSENRSRMPLYSAIYTTRRSSQPSCWT